MRGPRLIPNSSGGYIYTGVGKIGDFGQKSPFIPETVRGRPGNNPEHFFTLFARQTIAMPTHFLNFAHLPLHSRHIFFTCVNKINFHFFRLHGYVLRFVMYIVKLGTSWYWVRDGLGTRW